MLLEKWRALNKKIPVGARVLKTGIAITIAIYLAKLIGLPPVFAAIGASFATQPTVYRSYLSLINQLVANMMGAIIAVLMVLFIGNSPVLIGIGVMLTIWSTRKVKKDAQIGMAVFTVIAVMEIQDDSFIMFATERVLAIVVGVLAAFLVNVFLLPPKHEGRLLGKITGYTDLVLLWLERAVAPTGQPVYLRSDRDKILEKQVSAEKVYLLFKDERKFYKKKREYAKARKLVVYRQMISTTRQAYEVLRQFHRLEHSLHSFTDDFQERLLEQMEVLVDHHQQMHDHFWQDSHEEKIFEITNLEDLLNLLARLRGMENDDVTHVLHVMTFASALIEYGEHIQHLQSLLNSFHNHHETEQMVTDDVQHIHN